jgi:hypothetical protein
MLITTTTCNSINTATKEFFQNKAIFPYVAKYKLSFDQVLPFF